MSNNLTLMNKTKLKTVMKNIVKIINDKGLNESDEKSFVQTCMKGGNSHSPIKPTAASSGGAKVWVNDDDVYHCLGDRDYVKVKKGHYTTEAEARTAGAHPAQGKDCH